MTPPKKIEIRKGIIVGGQDVIAAIYDTEDMTYFSEEHIRAVANELYNNGDAFIAKLNGKSFSEYLKGASDD